MGWFDGRGYYYPGRAPNGMPRDGVGPDGYIVSGYRKVSKCRTVRFAKSVWTHEDFVPGEYVRCHYEWPTVVACIGMEGTTPENLANRERHHSFFDHSRTVELNEVATPEQRRVAWGGEG